MLRESKNKMAYEIHIYRYSNDFKQVQKIEKDEWKKCCQVLDNLKFVSENSSFSIKNFNSELKEWIPIFWIHHADGSGTMRAQGFEISIDKAFEIAEFLKAIIIGDEGEIYYLSQYGQVENATISIEELTSAEIHLDKNFDWKLKELISKRK